MSRILVVILAVAVAFGAAAPSLAQTDTLEKIKSSGVLTIGTRTGSPPFAYVNKNNEWVGFTIDLVEQLVKPSVEKAVGKSIKIEKKESTPPTRIPLLTSNAVSPIHLNLNVALAGSFALRLICTCALVGTAPAQLVGATPGWHAPEMSHVSTVQGRPSRSQTSPETSWVQLDGSPSGPSQAQHDSTSHDALQPFPGPDGPRSQASPGSGASRPGDGYPSRGSARPGGPACRSPCSRPACWPWGT